MPPLWTSWSVGPTLWWGSGWGLWLLSGLEGLSVSQTWARGKRRSYRCLSEPWLQHLFHPGSQEQPEMVTIRTQHQTTSALRGHVNDEHDLKEFQTYLSLNGRGDFVALLHDTLKNRVAKTWNQTQGSKTVFPGGEQETNRSSSFHSPMDWNPPDFFFFLFWALTICLVSGSTSDRQSDAAGKRDSFFHGCGRQQENINKTCFLIKTLNSVEIFTHVHSRIELFFN